jgi:hypothetical protein
MSNIDIVDIIIIIICVIASILLMLFINKARCYDKIHFNCMCKKKNVLDTYRDELKNNSLQDNIKLVKELEEPETELL